MYFLGSFAYLSQVHGWSFSVEQIFDINMNFDDQVTKYLSAFSNFQNFNVNAVELLQFDPRS